MTPLEIARVDDVSACTPSLMPFHISYTGPAPVARYFRPRPAPPSLPLSSSAATLVASSSSMTETQDSFTTVSSTTSIEALTPGIVRGDSQVEPAKDEPHTMEMDSETQPALGSDGSFVSSRVHVSAPKSVERLVAAFRGRQMYGQAVDIPDGYGGLVLRASADSKGNGKEDAIPSSKRSSQKTKPRSKMRAVTRRSPYFVADEPEGRDGGDQDADDDSIPQARRLIPSSTFASFTLWTPDRPLDTGRDEYARALTEWVHLASEIHTYDE